MVRKTKNKFYLAWMNMRRRCNGDKHMKDSQHYVDRGIKYCEEWNDFKNFFNDMSETYIEGLSLERIDNNVGYSKKNCRWATSKEQANNTMRNRRITINGITKNLSQWIEESGINSSTVRQRFYVYKWPIEKSLGFNKKEGY